MNPGRGGCAENPQGMPVQIWATWFPAEGKPQTFIQGFPVEGINVSGQGQSPFYFRIGHSGIEEESCRGALEVDGHLISWNLRYRSTFRVTLSSKGWIGFSRTPHSDAMFSGEIKLDGRVFAGDPLGFGVQGHNCGYRHRNFWTWTHAYFPRNGRPASTLEALIYEMPLGLVFRRAVLWHDGMQYVFRDLRDRGSSREHMQWNFHCAARNGLQLDAAIDGSGPSVHRLPYLKTNCSGNCEVVNNSLASASVVIEAAGRPAERLRTPNGAVLEMVS
jgi:hypothetical protein